MRIYAKKSLGQNFLINSGILDKIISSAELTNEDTVIEIGPGTGNLTRKLVPKAKKIIAIEKDSRLIDSLRKEFSGDLKVEIIEADVMNWKPEIKKYKIVANIPYYLTSNLIRKIFEEWPRPELIVLTVQKEVAQRIIAKPPHTNLLALSVQYFSNPEIISYISKNSFRPVPKMDSAIIRLSPKSSVYDPQLFNLLKISFSEKRKQLAGILSKRIQISKEELIKELVKLELKPTVRPEELSLTQWQKLSKII